MNQNDSARSAPPVFKPRRHDPDLRVVPLGFLLLILVGGILLWLPWSHQPGKTLAGLDAFFVAASAVCITGLAPCDIATVLSGFGQAVLLVLVQLGGLGIVTASLALVMLSGERLSLAHEGAVAATIGRLQRARPAQLFRYSCLMVVLFEAAGALLLYWRLEARYPTAPSLELLWQAVFHAVSAFCNAGFSILPGGLAVWREDAFLLGVMGALVLAGGIGLLSLINLRYYYFWRRNPRQRGRIVLQTKLAVSVSLWLLALGALATLLFEQSHTLAHVDAGRQWGWAFFHSVVTRTAGFNIVDIGGMHPATLLITMVLMFIGGSPGSLAGGIKTVTLAVLWGTARAALLRKEAVEMFGRRIAPRTSALALMIFLLSLAVVSLGIMALMVTELGKPAADTPSHWLGLTFEAVAAFGTTGLSTGVTGLLSAGGQAVVMVLMFAGRVGPLMLAVYLARPTRRWHVRHPEEDVALG